MIGNALEVVEVFDVLRGGGPEDLSDSVWNWQGGCCISEAPRTVAEGKRQSAQLISSGKALEKFP